MAAGATYKLISSTTLTSTQTSVTLSSIPQTYTDLIISTQIKNNKNVYIRFNSDSGTNYSQTYVYGAGGVAGSGRLSNQSLIYIDGLYVDMSDNFLNIGLVNIFAYSNSNVNKTIHNFQGQGAQECTSTVGTWRNTSAITSILVAISGAGTMDIGSIINVWGVTSA